MKKVNELINGRLQIHRIRHELLIRSGNKCAFPNCNSDLVTSSGRIIGEVCSIRPLNPNGPRGDGKLHERDLSSIDNYVFLCPTHHRLIDIEPDIYTITFLIQLKRNHEKQFYNKHTIINEIEIPEGISISNILAFWQKHYQNDDEELWQKLFTRHPHIISFIYQSSIIKIGEKCYVGGKNIENTGGNISDFIFKNKLTETVVIIELKTPITSLLGTKYRQNSYSISNSLSGAVVQSLNYKNELQRDFHRLRYESSVKFEVLEPVCLIIIGNLEEITGDPIKLKSFELFRRSLSNIQIITYDELFDKLQTIQAIVNN